MINDTKNKTENLKLFKKTKNFGLNIIIVSIKNKSEHDC